MVGATITISFSDNLLDVVADVSNITRSFVVELSGGRTPWWGIK